MSDTPVKPCTVCGSECEGKPRLKDPHGRYMHRACAEARMAARGEQPKPKPAVEAPAGDMMDMLIDDAVQSAPEPCPGCGKPSAAHAVICVNCGYNATTGTKLKSQVDKSAPDTGAMSSSGTRVLATAGSGFMFEPLLWVIGGCVGGAIGAAIWAALAYNLRVEIGWIAWVAGLLTGVGVMAGARGDGGFLPGVVAAFLSIISICGGKYAALSADANDYIEEASPVSEVYRPEDITDEEVFQ